MHNLESEVHRRLWIWDDYDVSSSVTDVPLSTWDNAGGCVWVGKVEYGNSLYFLHSFAVNVKLL